MRVQLVPEMSPDFVADEVACFSAMVNGEARSSDSTRGLSIEALRYLCHISVLLSPIIRILCWCRSRSEAKEATCKSLSPASRLFRRAGIADEMHRTALVYDSRLYSLHGSTRNRCRCRCSGGGWRGWKLSARISTPRVAPKRGDSAVHIHNGDSGHAQAMLTVTKTVIC
ncbi:hypothetical protein M3J09_008344 [Ascochyta lentis]